MTTATMTGIRGRVDALDWDDLRARLNRDGHAVTAPLFDAQEADDLAALFDGGRFRNTIDMARHRIGEGRYRYLDHPLPESIAELRSAFFRRLAPDRQRLGRPPAAPAARS